MKKFIINSALDMHLHLRDEDMLRLVAPLTSKNFAGALIMPNLLPPITTKDTITLLDKYDNNAVLIPTFSNVMIY